MPWDRRNIFYKENREEFSETTHGRANKWHDGKSSGIRLYAISSLADSMAFSMGDVQVAIRKWLGAQLTTDMKTVDCFSMQRAAGGLSAPIRRRLRAIFSGFRCLNRGDAGDYQVKSR